MSDDNPNPSRHSLTYYRDLYTVKILNFPRNGQG